MKKLLTTLILLLTGATNMIGQDLQKPADGKCLVYFFRYGGSTTLIDFKYFDGREYLGRAGGNNYYLYECEPGTHTFWLAAENREYISGDLKPNATYVIEVKPYYRAIMSGVELVQISPDDQKSLNKLYKLIKRQDPIEMKGTEVDQSQLIEKAMQEFEQTGKKAKQINPNLTF